MKKFTLIFAIVTMFFSGCEEFPHGPSNGEGHPGLNLTKKYSSDVAIEWINVQQKLIKTTAGFDPLVASRSFAYTGLALYESVVEGMRGYHSVVSPRIGLEITKVPHQQTIHWAASANAAMACIMKNLFASTSAANQATIDSLESSFNTQFEDESKPHIVSQSAEYGRNIANHIFEWSKTDGGHEAYLKATSDTYVPPTGPGKWIPTTPGSKPIRPYWGDNRTFVSNSAIETMPPPPPAYSESAESVFYKMADEVYSTSLSLSEQDIKVVKHWADLPGNYGTPAHYTHIATQLIQKNRFKLDQAALAYAKHGIALNEAIICVFKAKYTYNLIRPVSYIREAMGHTSWNTVIGTPPHPEYPSAHSVLGAASAVVMESFFGKHYSFVDKTHENLYDAMSYASLRAYAEQAANSRVLGGIHYNLSAAIGLMQGEEVGHLVNNIGFKGNPNNLP